MNIHVDCYRNVPVHPFSKNNFLVSCWYSWFLSTVSHIFKSITGMENKWKRWQCRSYILCGIDTSVFYRINIVLKPVERRENIIVCRTHFHVCVTKHVVAHDTSGGEYTLWKSKKFDKIISPNWRKESLKLSDHCICICDDSVKYRFFRWVGWTDSVSRYLSTS